MGAKAGIGTSTVALNLATALKKGKQPRSVVLVDLNLYSNDLALFLDMATPRGLRDLAGDLSRLDTTILKNLLVTHSSGIQLLAAGYQESEDTPLPPGCVLHTLSTLRTMFEFVVVDCGSTLELSARESLELSLQVMVVSQLSVPTIRRTKRLLQQVQQFVQSQGRVMVAVNRYLAKEAGLLKETEEVLGQKATWLIPNDYATVSRAIDSGAPLIQLAPRAGITQQYCRQAESLVQELTPASEPGRSAEAKRKESLLSKYLPLFASGKTTSQIV
jgi:pilus assembly protein CpaE